MNQYAYPWDDEIMAECRERKARVSALMDDWNSYQKHLRDHPHYTPHGKPWAIVSSEDAAAMLAEYPVQA
jgi:hypothetical protein